MADRTGQLSRSECLEPEVLSAYIDGTLEVRERAEVEAHLASCADCYDVMSEVLRIREELSAARPVTDAAPLLSSTAPAWAEPERRDAPAPAVRPGGDTVVRGAFGRRKAAWAVAGGVLAAAAALVLVVRLQPTWWTGGVDPKLADLVEAVGEERTVEARLTGGFKYGPLRSPVRSGGRVGPTDNWSLLAAAGRIREEAEKDPTAENLHALGVAQLLLGEHDAAVRELEGAAARQPSNPRFLNDLSAAYLARGHAAGRAADTAAALSTAEQAVRLDQQSTHARFNRALALEAINLRQQAISAWEDYLGTDSSSQWADEARTHLERLKQMSEAPDWDSVIQSLQQEGYSSNSLREAIEFNAQAVREHAEDVLFPAWASGDRQSSSAILDQLARLLDEHQVRTGDALLAQALNQILEADRLGDERLLGALRRGHRLWHQGKEAYARDQMTEMTAAFTSAAAEFRSIQSPFELWGLHFRVIGLYYAGRIGEARTLAEQLIQRADASPYPSLQGRLRWDRGTLLFQQAYFEAAAESYREAITRFEKVGEYENASAVHQLLAESLARLGEKDLSWEHHVASLAAWPRMRDARRRHTLAMGAGLSALGQALPGTALHLFSAGASNASSWRAPAAITECYINMARALVALGDRPSAQLALQDARAHISGITDAGMATKYRADLLEATSELAIETNPPHAIEAATEALTEYSAISSEYRLASLHLMRGRAHIALKAPNAAVADFDAGIELLESKRALIRQRDLRVSYLDSVWDLYGERALVTFELGMFAEALRFAERARARVLAEAVAGQETARIVDPSSLAAGLPADAAMVYLTALTRSLLIWVVQRKGITAHRVAITRAQLETDVHRYRVALAGALPDADAKSRELYRTLLEPLREELSGKRRLLFVPDSTSQTLPFASLIDPTTGRRVLQDAASVVLPSATTAVLLAAVGPRMKSRHTITLFRGGEQDAGVTLGALPDADEEIDSIARSYSTARIVEGPQATLAEFEQALLDSDVVHFAGHTTADPTSAEAPLLVLGTGRTKLEGGNSTRSTPRCSLVVLAACSTGTGRSSRGEGLLNLARPLLMRGIQAVLVTLWEVPDRETRLLQQQFHQALARLGDPGEALRVAQAARLNADPSDGTWAGFALIGTDASMATTRRSE